MHEGSYRLHLIRTAQFNEVEHISMFRPLQGSTGSNAFLRGAMAQQTMAAAFITPFVLLSQHHV
jgi:hypothetical protein